MKMSSWWLYHNNTRVWKWWGDKIGRIKLIFLQYLRKALDFHLPCIVMTLSGVPLNSNSVAPPILKQCPESWGRLASFYTLLQQSMNHDLIIGDYPWTSVSKAKKGALSGTETLAARWWMSADKWLVTSSTPEATIFVPSLWVVFVYGIDKTMKGTPVGVLPCCSSVLCEMWWVGSNILTESNNNSLSLYKWTRVRKS